MSNKPTHISIDLGTLSFRHAGPEDQPQALLKETIILFGIHMHVLAIQVGYGNADGTNLQIRTSADEEIIDGGACICAAHPDLKEQFLELHQATGSEWHLETVFIGAGEYAVFIFPFSI